MDKKEGREDAQGQPRCEKTNPGSVCCGRGCCDMLPVKEVQMTGNNPVVKEDMDGDVAFTVPDTGQVLPEIWAIDMIHSPGQSLGRRVFGPDWAV